VKRPNEQADEGRTRLVAGADPLDASQQRLGEVLDASADGFWERDLVTGQVLHSARMNEMVGSPPVDTYVGRDDWRNRMHPDDRAALDPTYQAVDSGRVERFDTEFRVLHADGTWRWIRSRGKVTAWDGAGQPRRVIGAVSDIHARKVAEAALLASEGRLRALNARLDSVREEEQRRIARDLHDDLGQVLAGLRLDVQDLEQRLAVAGLSGWLEDWAVGAAAHLDRAHASLRRITAGLTPERLVSGDLVAALRAEAEQFELRFGIRCEALIGALPPLQPASATALYRVAQEALTNVARHAHASRVELHLLSGPAGVMLRVTDDGRGLPEQPGSTEGLGVLGMRERAAQLGGTVRLERGPAGGVTVVAAIPLASTCR
jgi:two-component system sensor histidine kinase UhpB